MYIHYYLTTVWFTYTISDNILIFALGEFFVGNFKPRYIISPHKLKKKKRLNQGET